MLSLRIKGRLLDDTHREYMHRDYIIGDDMNEDGDSPSISHSQRLRGLAPDRLLFDRSLPFDPSRLNGLLPRFC